MKRNDTDAFWDLVRAYNRKRSRKGHSQTVESIVAHVLKSIPAARTWQHGHYPALIHLLLTLAYGNSIDKEWDDWQPGKIALEHIVFHEIGDFVGILEERSLFDVKVAVYHGFDDLGACSIIEPSSAPLVYGVRVKLSYWMKRENRFSNENVALCVLRKEQLHIYPAPDDWRTQVTKTFHEIGLPEARFDVREDLERVLHLLGRQEVQWLLDSIQIK